MDFNFSDLLAALNISSGLLAIYGAGAIILAVGFAIWLTDMIATWFDSHDDSDEEDEATLWLDDDEVICFACGWESDDEDAFIHAINTGHCPKCGE